MIAAVEYTQILASRYAVVDKPTACSRRKIARSPIRSRIVIAVPMKIAPMFSSTRISPARWARRPSGRVYRSPRVPDTASDNTPTMNGSSARNTK